LAKGIEKKRLATFKNRASSFKKIHNYKMISTKEELHRILDEIALDLPDTGRTAYVINRYEINSELGNPQQLIACWTQARKRVQKGEPTSKRSKTRFSDEEKPMIAAVARIYGDSIASRLFDVPISSVPAYRAHESMKTYLVRYDAVVLNGNCFVAPERSRPLSSLIGALNREYGSLEDIPDRILKHHNIILI